MTAALDIENLTLRFGGLAVLSEVSLSVAQGELLALIGPNGAGKTSVLNCVSGIYRGEGAIRLAGRPLDGLAPHAVARLGVGRTFQHGELVPQMTVMQNMLAGRHCRIGTGLIGEMLFLPRVRRAEIEHRRAIDGILSLLDLARYRDATVGALPLGVQKIIGFARALALEPSVLLLDEPSAGLNRAEREDMARSIIRIQRAFRPAMVWIEHDLQMVADLADRIHVLNYGRTLAVGSPDDVLRNPEVVAAYVGGGGQRN